MNTIGRYLKRRRIDNRQTGDAASSTRNSAKLTQQDVAAQMGIPQSRLCNLEQDRADWTDELIAKFDAAITELTKGGKK